MADERSARESGRAGIEAIFRREAARLISVLTRIFGPPNLELAEDVVQEAFVAALEVWSERGIPDNPGAWLLGTARNRAIDAIRRERTRTKFAADLAMFLDSEWTLAGTVRDAFEPVGLRDDQLRMIFMCCHPSISPENQLTLVLKTLCGLSVAAIARALLTNEAAINKRLYRTRRSLEGVEFRLPGPAELPAARETVHAAMYLLFNEGFMSTGAEPILVELCGNALAMTRLLADDDSLASDDTRALLALMCFNGARLESRLDAGGRLVPLDRQDRSLWDRDLIRQGYGWLARTVAGGEVEGPSRYQLEAAIAARHCSARTFAETDWESICRLYDRLLEVAPSGLMALNRAVAISYRDGPAAAIPLVEALGDDPVARGHSFSAVLANLHVRAGSPEPARRFLAEALDRAPTVHERELISRQIERARNNSEG